MVPKSSWFAVRCHFLPCLREGGQGGQTALRQLLLLQQLRAALFTVSVVRAFPLGRAVPGFPHTAQQITGFRVCWAKSNKGKKKKPKPPNKPQFKNNDNKKRVDVFIREAGRLLEPTLLLLVSNREQYTEKIPQISQPKTPQVSQPFSLQTEDPFDAAVFV